VSLPDSVKPVIDEEFVTDSAIVRVPNVSWGVSELVSFGDCDELVDKEYADVMESVMETSADLRFVLLRARDHDIDSEYSAVTETDTVPIENVVEREGDNESCGEKLSVSVMVLVAEKNPTVKL
jgi:hypothetical protein